MAHKIDSSSLLSRQYLKVGKKRVQYYGPGCFFGARNFRFHQIEGVVLSSDHKLSFQVGTDVYTLSTRPDKPRHQAAIDALLAALEQSRAGAAR